MIPADSLTSAQLLADATAAMGPPTILLAEDDPELRGLVQEALEAEGYDVVVAEDGRALLDRLGASDLYDLVLSDIRMPGCDGLRALESLRARDWATPIVFMTAFSSPTTREEAQRLGASVLDKPFDLDELVEHVRGVVPPRRYETGWR